MKVTLSGIWKLFKEIGFPIAIMYLLLCHKTYYEIAVHQDEQIRLINRNQIVLSACQINIASHMIQLYHSIDHNHLEENKQEFRQDLNNFRELLQAAKENEQAINQVH